MDNILPLNISGYLEHVTHRATFTKFHNFLLRRSFKKLQAIYSKRQAVLQGTDSDRDRLVVKRSVKRVFLECHLTAGGHRGRDAIPYKK